MKITKITSQVKRKDRFSVYLDEKYAFSLSEHQLASARLYIGKEFTQQELSKFLEESNFGKAYERALNYIMIRPRSEGEVKSYLVRTFLYPKPKQVTDKSGKVRFVSRKVDKDKVNNMIERIIKRLKDRKYLNDEDFAKSWINYRQLNKQYSVRKIKLELKQKGVSDEIIATSLQNLKTSDLENIKLLINKKERNVRYKDQNKLVQYLLRQGYNYSDIKDALNKD